MRVTRGADARHRAYRLHASLAKSSAKPDWNALQSLIVGGRPAVRQSAINGIVTARTTIRPCRTPVDHGPGLRATYLLDIALSHRVWVIRQILRYPRFKVGISGYDEESRIMALDISGPVSRLQRAVILSGCALAAVLLTAAENYLGTTTSLGGLFLLPLFVAAAYLSRWPTFVAAMTVAIAREYFGPTPWEQNGPERLALSLVAFTGGALFAGELIRNRRLKLEMLRKAKQETRLRQEAEQEVRALVESSPAAVITLDSDGRIGMANAAARQLLRFSSDSPEGESIEKYIPSLANLLKSKQVAQLMRTMVEARGRRRDGEEIYLQAWVSAYVSASGPRLAAVLLDMTEQVRDRAEAGLRQLLTNSRIIAGAVSHELRNLAAAAAVLHLNMNKVPGIGESADYKALGTVIESVTKLSSTDLSDSSEEAEEWLDVPVLLRELRTIIGAKFAEASVQLAWEVASEIPPVRANRSGLLQVLLNLAQNSRSVLEERWDGRLRITAYALEESVLIRFSDNGPGISSAERLFQPFQPGASSTGLGLFVSRAIIRTFGGELHHTQRPGECAFIIELPVAATAEDGRG